MASAETYEKPAAAPTAVFTVSIICDCKVTEGLVTVIVVPLTAVKVSKTGVVRIFEPTEKLCTVRRQQIELKLLNPDIGFVDVQVIPSEEYAIVSDPEPTAINLSEFHVIVETLFNNDPKQLFQLIPSYEYMRLNVEFPEPPATKTVPLQTTDVPKLSKIEYPDTETFHVFPSEL